MNPRSEIPGTGDHLKLGAVQVNVTDYKPFKDDPCITPEELALARKATRSLLDSLRQHTTFIPKGEDKTIANIELVNNEVGSRLMLMLQFGKADDPFYKPFNYPLPSVFRGKSVSDLHDALTSICRVDPGGNVPNMVRNFAHIMGSDIAPHDLEIELYTTADPTFEQWFSGLPHNIQDRIHPHQLSIPARKAFHPQYDGDDPGQIGTMGIGTPMHSTIRDMETHFGKLLDCNHVLTSESLTPLVNTPAQRDLYREFQNPSTAFRAQCASESYNHVLNSGRHIPIVTMNDAEMAKYITIIENRRAAPGSSSSSQDPDAPQGISFAAPFSGDTLNIPTVQDVTSSFERYFACITPKHHSKLHIPLNVSCGQNGGYHIAITPNGERIVVYSSTPDRTGAENMLSLIGPNPDISIDKKHTMGAGDAVATVLSLTHLWDIPAAIRKYATASHPLDEKFIETAGIMFMSLLSRVAGELLYHSDRCDWTSIPQQTFLPIVETCIRKSLNLAHEVWKNLPSATVAHDTDWNIKFALWQL